MKRAGSATSNQPQVAEFFAVDSAANASRLIPVLTRSKFLYTSNEPSAQVSTSCGRRWVSEVACEPCFSMRKGCSLTHPLPQAVLTPGLWLFVPPGKIATVTLGAVGIDPVAFDHPVERASIDAEDLGGACAVPAGDLEHIQQVTSFKLVEHRQIFKQSRQR